MTASGTGRAQGQAALAAWRAAMGEIVRRPGPELTPRQTAVLLAVYMDEAPRTVRDLAAELGVPKPAVTRALDVLAARGLAQRKPDPADGRNVFVRRTVAGSVFLTEMADVIGRAFAAAGLSQPADKAR